MKIGGAALALGLALAEGAAGGEWLLYENPFFRVYTDASERRTRPLVEELDRFRQGVLLIANWKIPAGAKPVEVFILDTGFQELVGQSRVGGVATRFDGALGEDGTTMLVMPARGYRGIDERVVLRHEYVHALARHRAVKFPRWYDEGIAEVFAHLRFSGQDIILDVPAEAIRNANFLAGFGIDGMGSLDDVVDMGHGQRRGMAGFQSYYLPAWLLAHYLTFGNPALAPQLEKCILYSDAGMPPVSAFKLAFGMTPAEMEHRHLRHYTTQLTGQRYKLARRIQATPFTLASAPPGIAEARLEVLRRRWAEARQPTGQTRLLPAAP